MTPDELHALAQRLRTIARRGCAEDEAQELHEIARDLEARWLDAVRAEVRARDESDYNPMVNQRGR